MTIRIQKPTLEIARRHQFQMAKKIGVSFVAHSSYYLALAMEQYNKEISIIERRGQRVDDNGWVRS